jgi:putative ABC transport system permease protein
VNRMDPTQVRGFGMLTTVALLRPNVSVAQAASEMETITARLRQQYPESNNRRFNRVLSLQNHLVGETGPMLLLLFGAVSFVLLIACANVANLLLASAATRQKEMAIRAALGASRFRVIRQLLTESLLLAVAGGTIGLLLALWGVVFLTTLLPQNFPRLGEINLDWRVLIFTLVASVLTGILFGLAPALQISRTDVQESLKENRTERYRGPAATSFTQPPHHRRSCAVRCFACWRWSFVSQLHATASCPDGIHVGAAVNPATLTRRQ